MHKNFTSDDPMIYLLSSTSYTILLPYIQQPYICCVIKKKDDLLTSFGPANPITLARCWTLLLQLLFWLGAGSSCVKSSVDGLFSCSEKCWLLWIPLLSKTGLARIVDSVLFRCSSFL